MNGSTSGDAGPRDPRHPTTDPTKPPPPAAFSMDSSRANWPAGGQADRSRDQGIEAEHNVLLLDLADGGALFAVDRRRPAGHRILERHRRRRSAAARLPVAGAKAVLPAPKFNVLVDVLSGNGGGGPGGRGTCTQASWRVVPRRRPPPRWPRSRVIWSTRRSLEAVDRVKLFDQTTFS